MDTASIHLIVLSKIESSDLIHLSFSLLPIIARQSLYRG